MSTVAITIEADDLKMRFEPKNIDERTWTYSIWREGKWLEIPLDEPLHSSDVLWNCALIVTPMIPSSMSMKVDSHERPGR
jgi:hypothetical protein